MAADTVTADRVITIDYGRSLQELIAAGNYYWADAQITAHKFPVSGVGTKTLRVKLFHFGRDISSDDAVAAMKEGGFEPATHVHGLAFGAAFPDEQRKYPIACLGSSAWLVSCRCVMCLDRDAAERVLCLESCGGEWSGRWRFLGIQEVSAT